MKKLFHFLFLSKPSMHLKMCKIFENNVNKFSNRSKFKTDFNLIFQ